MTPRGINAENTHAYSMCTHIKDIQKEWKQISACVGEKNLLGICQRKKKCNSILCTVWKIIPSWCYPLVSRSRSSLCWNPHVFGHGIKWIILNSFPTSGFFPNESMFVWQKTLITSTQMQHFSEEGNLTAGALDLSEVHWQHNTECNIFVGTDNSWPFHDIAFTAITVDVDSAWG